MRKIGATSEEAVDVRIISATHQDLEECVANKRFRQDLYYRLNVIELQLPALRARLDDVELLSEGILQRLSGRAVTLAPDALAALLHYDFPGNVRELENILERALAFANDGIVQLSDLAMKSVKVNASTINTVVEAAEITQEASTKPVPVREPATIPARVNELAETHAKDDLPASGSGEHLRNDAELPKSLPAYLEQVEREIILRALQKTRYNKTQAAELLGVSFRQLRYQIQKLKIDESE